MKAKNNKTMAVVGVLVLAALCVCSLSRAGNIVDLDNDGYVDYNDLMLLCEQWLRPGILLPEDLDRDGSIDFDDFAILGESWGQTEDPNLVGHWKMDDNSADTIVIDSSGKGNDGTAQQNTSVLSTIGKINGALAFNGAGDYVVIPKESNLVTGTDDFTITGWINPDSVGPITDLIAWQEPSSAVQFVITDGAGNTGIWADSKWLMSIANTFTPDLWYHITWTRNGDAWKAYINGSQIGSDVLDSASLGMPTLDYHIGAEATAPSQLFSGAIDDVRIYNRALSEEEIAALYGCYKPEKHILIATWNVRGYPETEQLRREWFSEKLIYISPDIICVQEIANQERVDTFLTNESRFTSAAFLNSSDGQDNTIFAAEWVEMEDIPDPNGFQHPAQAAYVAYDGFDAVIATIHLSWKDVARREQEKALLQNIVVEMLQIDPDVIIAGDFNTKEQGIQELAELIGMVVMVPVGQDGIGTTQANNRYDHFLISPDLANEEAIACQIQTFPGEDIAWDVSDHIPVLAVFRTDSQFKDRE